MSELVQESASEEIKQIAEAKKKAGNDAFAEKKYDEAIRHYSEAIELDASNHVYFSNRSACYSSKGEWDKSASDAEKCIELNPDFIKGYHRLSSAQLQLLDFDRAEETVRRGLKRDTGNGDLLKQLRMIKAKKTSALARARRAAAGGERKAQDAAAREIIELADAVDTTAAELRETASKVAGARREGQRTRLTLQNVGKLPAEGGPEGQGPPLYRAVGKMFLKSTRPAIVEHLEKQQSEIAKTEESLLGRQAYLERRLKSQQTNLKELQKGA